MCLAVYTYYVVALPLAAHPTYLTDMVYCAADSMA